MRLHALLMAFAGMIATYVAARILLDAERIMTHAEKDGKLRSNLRDHQVDDMIMDSFPASDPPSTY